MIDGVDLCASGSYSDGEYTSYRRFSSVGVSMGSAEMLFNGSVTNVLDMLEGCGENKDESAIDLSDEATIEESDEDTYALQPVLAGLTVQEIVCATEILALSREVNNICCRKLIRMAETSTCDIVIELCMCLGRCLLLEGIIVKMTTVPNLCLCLCHRFRHQYRLK